MECSEIRLSWQAIAVRTCRDDGNRLILFRLGFSQGAILVVVISSIGNLLKMIAELSENKLIEVLNGDVVKDVDILIAIEF